MKNHSIIYERDINKSYMKVPAVEQGDFDENIMLRTSFAGTLPVEKCFVNGEGQYWYNITGKQALEDYCRIHEVEKNLFETLILRICNQLEVMEWNLMDTNCLVVSPEYIFLNSAGDALFFVLYPENQDNVQTQLQNLLEFLLSKLNHSDSDVVKIAYQIYEMVLSESYSVKDLKDKILEGQKREIHIEPVKEKELEVSAITKTDSLEYSVPETSKWMELLNTNEKLAALFEKIKEILQLQPQDIFSVKRENKEQVPEVVFPDEKIVPDERVIQHPTVCLSSIIKEVEGRLIYEGREDFDDFALESMLCVIGKSQRAKFQIPKETVSNFHAKIDCVEGEYYIEDMNSTNGTFVNEEMLNYKEVRKLYPGDVIRFADVKYRFL